MNSRTLSDITSKLKLLNARHFDALKTSPVKKSFPTALSGNSTVSSLPVIKFLYKPNPPARLHLSFSLLVGADPPFLISHKAVIAAPMSSPSKKSLLGHPAVVDTGCRCRSSKLSAFFSWSSAQKQRLPKTPISYTTSPTTSTSHSNFSHDAATTHPFSPSDDSNSPWPTRSPSPMNILVNTLREKKQGIAKGGVGESVEVVVESWNPCVDFRESMIMMIVEKEIYAWDDLRELLRRFLLLNSPYHHLQILRAFAEALNEVFSPSTFAGESSGQRPERKEAEDCEEEDHKEEERGGRVIKTSLSM